MSLKFLSTVTGWLNGRATQIPGLLLAAASVAAGAAPGEKLWEFPVGASVQSSPALGRDGTIYFGADNGAFYALDAKGKKKWEFRAAAGIAASPAIGPDGTIYVGSADRILYALNPDGTEEWRLRPGSGFASSPAVGPDGIIYVGSVFGVFYAVDPLGYLKWEFPAAGNILSSPAVGTNGTIYFGSWDTNFYAVQADGARKWLFSTEGRITSSPAIGPDGTLYFGSMDHFVYALTPAAEKLWDYRTEKPVSASPSVGPDGTVYIGSDDKKLYAFTTDGKKKWEFATGGEIRSTPALSLDGTLYVGSYDGKLYALGTNGVKKWDLTLGAAISSSPVISPTGVIYFGSRDQSFYAVQGEAPPATGGWPMFHANPRHTGSLAREGALLASTVPTVEPPAPVVPPPEPPEQPKIILPPVAEPTFTNRVGLPPVRFTGIAATPRELILSNETIFLKPPPKPPRPPIERIRQDKTKPKLTIKSPDEKARFTHPLLVVEGTAKDNEGLERVEYRFNNGEAQAADGLGDWTIRINMPPGQNTLQIRAVDLAGNPSDWTSRTFTYLITSPLLVQINGQGEISPNVARDLLEVGKTYSVTAEPGRGCVFGGWTGGVKSDKPKLDFIMRSNLVLTANFVPKPSASKAPPKEKAPDQTRALVTLNVQVAGYGTIKPEIDRKSFEIGKTITLTARPEKGHVFGGWKGALTNTANEISFVARSNMTLQAEFWPSPYSLAKGSYVGLIWDTNGVSHENSGLLSLQVGDEAKFKGKLSYGGSEYPLDGQFDPSGKAQKLIVRNENRSLRLEMTMVSGKPLSPIMVSLRAGETALAFACAKIDVEHTKPLPAPPGRYTAILMGLGRTPGPAGDGCASIRLDPAGTVVLSGTLSDGSLIECNGTVFADGRCPLYLPLYAGHGSLSGWLRFGVASTNASLDVSGELAWFKSESPKDRLYPKGFSRLLSIAGSRYTPPVAGSYVLSSFSGVVALRDGNLPEAIGNLFELDARNKAKVTFASEDKFSLEIIPGSGLFSGAFLHPVTKKNTGFKGAILQKLGWGSGYFVGSDQSGLVFLGPNQKESEPEAGKP